MPVELFILCGFLGSGKTSLLVEHLRSDAAGETGVIVNEFGDVGVEGVVLSESGAVPAGDTVSRSGPPLQMLANGCVCCSLQSDLVRAIGAILDAPRPAVRPPVARIILETSGISRPGPIVASLADPALLARQLRLMVVSTWDCTAGAGRAQYFDEAAAQLAAAQRIVLTKTDLVNGQALAASACAARGFNPLATIIAETDRARAVGAAFAAQAAASQGAAAKSDAGSDRGLQALSRGALFRATRHPRIRVFTARAQPAVPWTDFAEWLDDLAGLCGERLLRVKAVVRVTDCAEPLLIQSVGTTFSAPQRLARQPNAQTVVIVIVRDMTAAELAAGAPASFLRLSSRA